ncbi:CDP-glycerol glycerophosphotransferase family protein, partial [Lactiplantibacillus mudanjiangensis]|uniref:CDP-glycerol glycerophosphotransferase family protein n=1 Tax=Lactiplantibacillus mudanjiangensis TaxID=1296538 RepID=UPI00178205BC
HNVKITGLPRNRELVILDEKQKRLKRAHLRKKYMLDPNKPVLLYAPTFREYDQSSQLNIFDEADLKHLSKKYNLLFRGHYFVGDNQPKKYFIDVSNEQNLNDLMLLSDLLVSDYSSIVFDYALLNKPIVLFCYDLEKYLNYRGVYIDPRKLGLPIFEDVSIFIEKVTTRNFELPAQFNDYFNAYFDEDLKKIKKVILKGGN